MKGQAMLTRLAQGGDLALSLPAGIPSCWLLRSTFTCEQLAWKTCMWHLGIQAARPAFRTKSVGPLKQIQACARCWRPVCIFCFVASKLRGEQNFYFCFAAWLMNVHAGKRRAWSCNKGILLTKSRAFFAGSRLPTGLLLSVFERRSEANWD